MGDLTARPAAPLTLRRAALSDLGGLMVLFAQAAERMHAAGYTAWPRGGFPASRIGPDIADGTVWVLHATGPGHDLDVTPLAAMTLNDRPDPEHTAAGLDPAGTALVMHRLARAPRAAGQGLGELMLGLAVNRAAQLGLREVWINVNRAGVPLQEWYLRHGFTHTATVTATGRQSGWLASRPARRVPTLPLDVFHEQP